MTLITVLLILLVILVNVEENKKVKIVYQETNQEENKEPFKFENIGTVMYRDYPIIGWIIFITIIIIIYKLITQRKRR